MKREFPTSLIVCAAVVSLFVYFEYYYVTVDGVPYRELTNGGFMQLPPYFVFPLLPAFVLVAFSPLIAQLVDRSNLPQINRKLWLSLANFLFIITAYDALFYVLRVVAPLPTDPLAGVWVVPGEDSTFGLVNLFGTLIPTWYFLTIPIFASVYLAYYMTSHEPMQQLERPVPIHTSPLNADHGLFRLSSQEDKDGRSL